MSANPLVAAPEGPSSTAGTFLLDDIVSLSSALETGSWVSAGLSGLATTFDAAATVSDPFGSLIAAGLGFCIDHFNPPKRWMDELVGNPAQVEAFAKTYENVAEKLTEEAEFVRKRVEADLTDQTGEALHAYKSAMGTLADSIDALAAASKGTAGGLKYAGMIVEIVHTTVRDTISQLVGAAISWAAEETFSLGLATGWVIEQISTRVAQITSELGGMIKGLITSMKALEKIVNDLDKGIGKVRDVLDLFHPNAARGAHAKPWLDHPSPDGATHTPKHSATDEGPRHAKQQTPLDRLQDRLGDTVRTEFPRNPLVEGAAGESNYYKRDPE